MNQSIKILTTLFAGISTLCPYAQTPDYAWQKKWQASQAVQCREIAYDANGDVYVAGTFRSTLDMDPGSGVVEVTAVGTFNGFIVKLNQEGEYIWHITYPVELSVTGMVVSGDGDLLIAGRFQNVVDFDPGADVTNLVSNGLSDAFVARYTSAGDLEWALGFGGDLNNGVEALAEAPDGSIYIGGDYRDSTDFDPGVGQTIHDTWLQISNGYVSKYSPSGDFISVELFRDSIYSVVNALQIDLDGNVFATGIFLGTMVFGPDDEDIFTAENTDMFIAKYSNDGTFLWVKRSEGTANINIGNMDIDHLGQLYLTGTLSGGGDFDPGPGVAFLGDSLGASELFLLKYDNDGGLVWAKELGAPGTYEFGADISVDADANVYVTGYVDGPVDFDLSENEAILPIFGEGDAFALKLDTDGGFLWATLFGNNQNDFGNRIMPHPDGSVYLSGHRQPSGDSPHSFGYLYKFAASSVGVGAELHADDGLHIFPNPSNGLYQISALEMMERIIISDISGKAVTTFKPQSTDASIDLSAFPAGVYMVQVLSANGYYAKRIVKE